MSTEFENEVFDNQLTTVGEVVMSPSVEKLFEAMSKFTQQVEQPSKDGVNNHTKNKYVKLEGVVAAVKSGMKETGLSYIQVPVSKPDFVGTSTIITHSSGQFMKFPAFGFSFKTNKPHDVGSYMTYARRYSLSAAFGLASDEDDDGNHANNTTEQMNQQQQNKPPQIDREKLLSEITLNLQEIAEVTKTPIVQVRDKMLMALNIEDFKFLKGVDLQTGHATVARQLKKVKEKAEKDALVAKAEANKKN